MVTRADALRDIAARQTHVGGKPLIASLLDSRQIWAMLQGRRTGY